MRSLTILRRITLRGILRISIGEADNVLIKRGGLDYSEQNSVAVAQDMGTNICR